VIFLVMLAFRELAKQRNRARGRYAPGTSWRRIAWGVAVVCSLTSALILLLTFFAPHPELLAFFVLATPGVLLVSAAPILSRFARLGRPRTAFVLAHVLFVFGRTDETFSGAVLFAALAIAHRGAPAPGEIEWLRSRLVRSKRAYGVFGCACAVVHLLEARAARDAGRSADAEEASLRARAILGTLTYTSNAATTRTVKRLTNELLALLHSSRGEWAHVSTLPDEGVNSLALALRGYANERLAGAPRSEKTSRARRRVGARTIDELFARPPPSQSAPIDDVLVRGRAAFLALGRGEPVGFNSRMMMLVAFDALLSPEFERTAIPADARANADLVAAMQEEAASAITALLLANPPPIGALGRFGPVSARVHQKLESALFDELSRVVSGLRERAKQHWRYDPYREWVDVSMTRVAFRKIEQTFGPAASAQVWPSYAHAYCNLGVQLSETEPRRRPLAHAVFESLRRDAERYGDKAQLEQQRHNTRVTAGIS
jgi:hypothetical protein